MFQADFRRIRVYLAWLCLNKHRQTLLLRSNNAAISVVFFFKHTIRPHHETISGYCALTLGKWYSAETLQPDKIYLPSLVCHPFNCPFLPPPRPRGFTNSGFALQESREEGSRTGGGALCVPARGIRGEESAGRRALTEAACGEDGKRGDPLRCCRVVVVVVVVVLWGGYHCSSRNNVNVEQAGDRCFVEKEAERQTAEEDRARVTDIPLKHLRAATS